MSLSSKCNGHKNYNVGFIFIVNVALFVSFLKSLRLLESELESKIYKCLSEGVSAAS